jgi:expansin (peptidoglycan-binding protein)
VTAEHRAHARHIARGRFGVSPRWLAAGGAAVLGGVIGVALLLQNGGAPACAAPPTGNATRTGKATFYDLGPGGTGNCSFATSPADGLFVALGPSQYSEAGACGSYLDITGPKGSVRVKVTDQCPECEPGHLDLSRKAFKKIADEVQGIVPIKYKAVVNPGTPGPLSVRIKEGASRYWFAALIDNHANPLTSVTVKGPGFSARAAKRAAFNYWIIDGGAGTGPYTLTVRDVYGRSATVNGIDMQPGTVQTTSTRISGSAGSAPKAGSTPKKAKRSASPSPSASVSASASPSASASASGTPTNTASIEAATAPVEPVAGDPVALAAAQRSCG